MDGPTGEVLLRVGVDENGHPHIYFHLYDRTGFLTAESRGTESFANGLQIHAEDGELLLDVPAEPDAHILYCLYNQDGVLLTRSNGVSTKIKALLRMDGGRPQGPGARR